MKYILWDRTSNINSCSAADYLANHPEMGANSEIVLVTDDSGVIMYVENATMLRTQLGLDASTDAITVVTTNMTNIAAENEKAASAASATAAATVQTNKDIADIQYAMMMGGLI
jgi:hypothetical protein